MTLKTRTTTIITGTLAATALFAGAAFASPRADTAVTLARSTGSVSQMVPMGSMAQMMGGQLPEHMADLDDAATAEMMAMMNGGAAVGEMHQWMRDQGISIGQAHREMRELGMDIGQMHGAMSSSRDAARR